MSAVAVLLATVGSSSATPKSGPQDVEPLRRTVQTDLPDRPHVSYLAAGDVQGPRIIFVHGTPGSASAWAEYLVDPLPGAETVAIDRPGFGQSGPKAAVTSLAAQAAAVVALLPTDGRGVVLVGHSLGGPIAAWVAAQHPDKVSALVLLAASLDPELEEIHPMQHVGMWWPIRALLPRSLRNSNDELLALKPELVALQGMLGRITAPVMIVHGTADALVPVANVRFIQTHLTGARCVETVLLPEANHFIPWNAQAAIRTAVRWGVAARC